MSTKFFEQYRKLQDDRAAVKQEKFGVDSWEKLSNKDLFDRLQSKLLNAQAAAINGDKFEVTKHLLDIGVYAAMLYKKIN